MLGTLDYRSSRSIRPPATNPLPVLTSASPSTEPAGTTDTVVTLTGNNFFSESTVYLNGVAKTTTYISKTSVSFTIPTASMAIAGNLVIWVQNSSGNSPSLLFPITSSPIVSNVSPSVGIAGDGNTVITIGGTGFLNPSVAKFGGTVLTPTTFVSSSSLTATVPSSLLVSAGSKAVTVVGAAGSATFTIQASAFAADDSALAPTGYETVCALNTALTVYNVKNAPYNAVGDGVADDTVPIRTALAAAVAGGGGIIYLPAGTYAVAPQVGDVGKLLNDYGQLGPYAVTISGSTITGATAASNFNVGMSVYFPNVGTLPQISGVNVNTGVGNANYYYVGNISGTTFKLFTTYANAIANTSPITFSSAGSGVNLTGPVQTRIFTIRSGNIVFIGDHDAGTGAPTTFIKGYTIGLNSPTTNWFTIATNLLGRFWLFDIAPSADSSVVQFRSLDIDGQAGWTGIFPAAGGNPATGDGWDEYHKAFVVNVDASNSHRFDNILIFNCNVKNFRGEHIFTGGQLTATSAIIGRAGGDGRNSIWKSTNASSIANSGQWTYVNIYLGGTGTNVVQNGFETQLGPLSWAGESQTFKHVTVEGATANSISIGNEAGTTVSISDLISKNSYAGIQLTDTATAVTVDSSTFTGSHYSIRESSGNQTGLVGGAPNHLTFSNISHTGYNSLSPFFYLQGGETNISLSNITDLQGGVLSGVFGNSYAAWGSFTVDGTVFAAAGAQDNVSVFSGTAAPLYTNSTRPGTYNNCGDYWQFTVGPGPFTIAPQSDATRIQNLPDNVGPWQIQIDHTKLASFPDQYTVLFYIPFYTSGYLKADATWNDFVSDVHIVSGTTKIKYQTSTGKFTQLA